LKADRKIKTIAGRLLREIQRKLSPEQLQKYFVEIELHNKVMRQRKADKNKIYSLREPHTECISKGKIHKRYEFGSKVSIMIGKKSGIIYRAKNIEKNVYDGNTLPYALSQFKEINGYTPERVIADLGYRGIKYIDETEIITSQNGKNKSKNERNKQRKEYRRRSSIEGKISHLMPVYYQVEMISG